MKLFKVLGFKTRLALTIESRNGERRAISLDNARKSEMAYERFLSFLLTEKNRTIPLMIIREENSCPMVRGPRMNPSCWSGSLKNSTKNRKIP